MNVRNPQRPLAQESLHSENTDVILYGSGMDAKWVVPAPNQIKSATDNVGSFSTDNNDIRYQAKNSTFAGNLSAKEMKNTIKLKSPQDITDADFNEPSRNVVLPSLSANTLATINSVAKPVLIKQNVFEKNRKNHPDVSAEDGRKILNTALNNPTITIQGKPLTKPNYWMLVKIDGKNAVVTIDAHPSKANIEVVHWWWSREKSLEQIKKRAIREGGQVLITN